ncbi:hypothetical protein H7H98_05305, partial [Mycolicibacterium sphagni]|nr:hypothetical protein [Mycolicibacterium sphagni]
MRLKPGRPDSARYADLFAVPAATADTAVSFTWLGVSTLLIDDGTTAIMTDGFFSRPSLARIGLGRIAPSKARVDGCLPGPDRTGPDRAIEGPCRRLS